MSKQRVRGRDLRVAYHEAGHGVAAFLLRRTARYITIEPGEGREGCVVFQPLKNFDPAWQRDSRTERIAFIEIGIGLAEDVAESIWKRRKYKVPTDIGTQDWRIALNVAMALFQSPPTAGAYAQYAWLRMTDLLSQPAWWATVKILAKRLLRERKIGLRDARKIIKAAISW